MASQWHRPKENDKCFGTESKLYKKDTGNCVDMLLLDCYTNFGATSQFNSHFVPFESGPHKDHQITTYGFESWTLRKADMLTLEAFEMRCLGSIIGVRLLDKVRNVDTGSK